MANLINGKKIGAVDVARAASQIKYETGIEFVRQILSTRMRRRSYNPLTSIESKIQ